MPFATPRPRSGLVIEPDEFAVFTWDLGELGRSRNLSNAEIVRRAGHHKMTGLPRLSSSDVSRLASGAERLSEEKVLAFVEACGADTAEWQRRYRCMAAAFDRHREELDRQIVDKPYTELSQPSSPLRFNIQLKKRIIGAGESQNQIARKAHFSQQKVSNNFNSNQIVSEDFTRRILKAVEADDDEIATWLRWRCALDCPPAAYPVRMPVPESGATASERAEAERAEAERRSSRKGPFAATAVAALLFTVVVLTGSDTRVTHDGPAAAPPPVTAAPSAPGSTASTPPAHPTATPASKAASRSTATPKPPATTPARPTPTTASPAPAITPRGTPGTIVDPTGHGHYLGSQGLNVDDVVIVQCEIVGGGDHGSFRTADGKTIPPQYVRFDQPNPVIPHCKD